jgi:hypothetical protein
MAELATATETPRTRSPFAAFEAEIIDRVIRPKLVATIQTYNPGSLAELYEHFREDTGTSASDSTIKAWLAAANIQVTRSAASFKV